MQDLGKFDEEFTNFMHRVNEVNKIVKKLNSTDKNLQNIAILEADQYLKEADSSLLEQINEENVKLKIKSDRTVINKGALLKNENPDTMSQEAFMNEVAKDADRRYKNKLVRKERMETFKKQGNLAFRRGEYERALNCYNKAIEQIKDSCMLYNNRCLTNIKLKLYQNAIADADLSLRIDENNIKSRLLLAKAQYLNEDVKDYLSTIEEARNRHQDQNDFINDFIEKLKLEAETEENL
ncbi:hypothetical protein Trydic_g23294 [Trypoxylus dichotomus]